MVLLFLGLFRKADFNDYSRRTIYNFFWKKKVSQILKLKELRLVNIMIIICKSYVLHNRKNKIK